MNLTAITFVDEKFMPLALEQKANFNSFGVEHEIIQIPEKRYNIMLWMDLIDYTIDAIKKYKKIFRVDSEIRLLKTLPDEWNANDNVLFFIEPICLNPWYVAINTGHMILSESSIPFLECLKTMTLALLPPNYNGELLKYDDEDLTSPALAVSKIPYLKEIIDYNRSDESTARCTRGSWYTEHTVFTHPFLHNWNTIGHHLSNEMMFRNHFIPGQSTKIVDGILLGLKNKVKSEGYWKSLGFESDNQYWKRDQWLIDPFNGAFTHRQYGSFKQPY